jgi:hypothetical protein
MVCVNLSNFSRKLFAPIIHWLNLAGVLDCEFSDVAQALPLGGFLEPVLHDVDRLGRPHPDAKAGHFRIPVDAVFLAGAELKTPDERV